MMEKKKNVPVLRFPEFSGEWKQKKLGEVADIKTGPFGSALHQSDYVSEGTPIITVEHLGELGIVHENLPLVSDFDLKRLKSYLLQTNDIVFSRVGSVDRNSRISNSENGWLFSGRLLRIRFDDKIIDSAFVSNFFQKETTKQSIRSVAVGQTMASLNTEILKGIELYLTIFQEQQKIASILTSLDNKLQSLKKKKTLLEQYKKGMMQKIFSQGLRFKDDNGNEFPKWQKKKISDIFKVTRGNVLSMLLVRENINDTNIYPVYSSQTKNKGLSGFYDKYLFENCITWTTDGANAGDVNYRIGKFYCTNVCGVLISDKGYANLCVSEILNLVSGKYVSYVGNPKLMNNVMSEIAIVIPASIFEQTKIANFLSAIDNKINLCNAQIEKTEQWKKGLLQKMFV